MFFLEKLSSRWDRFLELLQKEKSRPRKEVLDRIAIHHYAAVDAAASSVERAVALYEMVKDLPSTSTRVVLQEQLNIHINGLSSPRTPNILTAVDESENLLVLKLLRPSDRVPYDIRRAEQQQERETCEILGLKNPQVEALCPVEVIDVVYEERHYWVLKMP